MNHQGQPRTTGGVRDPRLKNSEKELSLTNLNRFDRDFPVFQIPKYVGSFSLDIHRNYHHDLSELKYLALPLAPANTGTCRWKVEYNLRKGIKNAIGKNEQAVKATMLDHLLAWIVQERSLKNSSIINPEKPMTPLELDFVCFRGLLTMIMGSPYEKQEDWMIVATKFENTIYLFQVEKVDDASSMRNNRNPLAGEMTMWGYKFEQYLCTNSIHSSPDPEEVMNVNSEFCCIIKTKLAGLSLLYGAEVDALRKDSQPPWLVESDKTPTLDGFVELKTTRLIENERQRTSFYRYKTMKWWAQSFIVGIPTILCGYRDDHGMVTDLETLDVKDLRKFGEDFWLPRVCMNFCQLFLEFVKQSLPMKSEPNNHCVFHFNARQRTVTVLRDYLPTTRPLLPSWYIDAMSKPMA